MPRILPTRCADPMCGRLATNRGRCDQHQRPPWQNPSANSRALTGNERNQWRKLIIKDDSRCENCGTTEQLEADHRIPISQGGARLDTNNGAVLCHSCHLEKTIKERSTR